MFSLVHHKLQFWEENKNSSKNYPTMFIEGYYEILKELGDIILIIDGWKSNNHDCIFQYLKENKKDLEIDFDFLSDIRQARNRINYGGIKLSYDIWKRNELNIKLILKRMMKYIEDKLNK